MILGEGFSPTAEPFRSLLTDLGAKARGLLETMAPADGSLWPDAVFADPDPDTDAESFAFSGRMADSFARLNTMAQAYRQQGTGLTGSTALRDAVLTGLEHLNTQVYNDRQTRYGNWYSWQIGAPQALLDVCVLLYDAIAPERLARYCAAVDHFVPDSAVASYTGTSTGANRVDLCRVLALRGAVGASAAKIALARDALSPVFPLVSKGDGLYADGSFIQHTTVPYTGSYGSVMLGGLGMLFALLKGSDWEVTDPKKQVVFDAVENAWAPFLFNGLVMDAVAGRAISRGEADDHRRGHPILASIVLLGQGASAAENTRWRSLVKGWAQRDYYSPPLSNPSLGLTALSRIKNVLDDTALAPLPEPDGHRLFPDMARATHRRPGWAASLSMADRRVTYYETGNGENLRGWHTGSGMLYWWGDTFANGQYSDAFWPTVDPYRLPGTTASRKALANGASGDWGASLPDVNWVGGATDGKRAAVGQYLRGLSSTLMAKKSWFFLDDTVVCLGGGHPVPRRRDRGDHRRQPQPRAHRQRPLHRRRFGQAPHATLVGDAHRRVLGPSGRPRRLRVPGRGHRQGAAGEPDGPLARHQHRGLRGPALPQVPHPLVRPRQGPVRRQLRLPAPAGRDRTAYGGACGGLRLAADPRQLRRPTGGGGALARPDRGQLLVRRDRGAAGGGRAVFGDGDRTRGRNGHRLRERSDAEAHEPDPDLEPHRGVGGVEARDGDVGHHRDFPASGLR